VDSLKGVPLLAFVDIAAHFGNQIAPQKTIFFFGGGRGVNRHAPNIEIFIPIDHNQVLQGDRDPQVLTVRGPNMPQTNLRWQTATIIKNRKILISSQLIDRF